MFLLVGDSPHPVRSPLREKNVALPSSEKAASPRKVVRTSTFTKAKPSSSDGGSGSGSGSPSRIRTNATASRRGQAQQEIHPDKEEKTLSKEVTEKRTTVEGSPVREGNKETYTKTTITEKEEKVHKKHYVRFTGISEQGIDKLVHRYADDSGDDDDDDDMMTTTTTKKTIVHESRSRSPSPKSFATPSRSPPKRKTPSPLKEVASGGIVTSARRQFATYDEDTFGESGRKRRLAALAKKFHKYDADDDPMEGPAQPSTPLAQDMSVTKEVDVDEELAEINEAAEKRAEAERRRSRSRSASPTKGRGEQYKNVAKDPEFVRSLRAQGFEETESKTKLVYDFNKRSASPTKSTILSSPTKTAAEPRSTSPFKPHPLQFVSPQVNKEAAAVKSAAAPTPPAAKVTPARPSSPYKPHPMQFISPQRAHSPTRQVPASEPPRPPPNKPVRTWATASNEDETPKWRTETTVQVTNEDHVTPVRAPAPPPKPPQSEPMTDTASRRSLAQKWSMFEGRAQQDASPDVDPAMMTLSERRALFEKNRTAPKPVARFGDAVTPSMLSKGQGRLEAKDPMPPPPQPKNLFASGAQRSPTRRNSPTKYRAPSPPPAATKRPASPSKPEPSPKRSDGSPRRRSRSPHKMILKDGWKQEELSQR